MPFLKQGSIEAEREKWERERQRAALLMQLQENDTEQQGGIDTALGCVMELAEEVFAEPVREDVTMLKGCIMEMFEMIAPLLEE